MLRTNVCASQVLMVRYFDVSPPQQMTVESRLTELYRASPTDASTYPRILSVIVMRYVVSLSQRGESSSLQSYIVRIPP